MKDVLVVDGDNVAHARWRGRRGRRDVPRMRGELVEAVAGYAAAVGLQAVVVFDGAGEEADLGATAVRYSEAATADDVIERLAYELEAAGSAVTVVSADRELRRAVSRGAVHVVGPSELLRRMEREAALHAEESGSRQRYRLGEALDASTRAALERMRRGRPPA